MLLDDHLVQQWHPTKNAILPEDVRPQSNKKAWWQDTTCGHEWEAIIANRSKGQNCPYCANKRVLAGFNDVASHSPQVAAQWHPTKNGTSMPETTIFSSHTKMWWSCELGHEWQSSVRTRTQRNHGCPQCAGQQVITGINDLATLNPELALQWHPTKNELTAYDVMTGSNKKVWWLCNAGHAWEAMVNTRSKGVGCPYCSGHKVTTGENDLATVRPDIAAQWHPTKNGDLLPSNISPFNALKVWWQCQHGHDTYVAVGHKTLSCSVCTGHTIALGVNDLAHINPELAAQWHPVKNNAITPHMVTVGSDFYAWWQCSKDHEWKTQVKNRASGIMTNCPHCFSTAMASQGEQELAQWLRSLGIRIVVNDRKILHGKELDIVVPDKKVALEFNGVFWHSEQMLKDKNYHAYKKELVEKHGYRLVQVWEDDWRDRKSIVKRMILHRLHMSSETTVAARKCKVINLDYQSAKNFLDENHIQGGVRGTYYLGLISGTEVVAVCVILRKKRHMSLERYATSCRVPGGMGKFVSYITQQASTWQVDTLVTFADMSISQGNLYDVLGFKEDSRIGPDYMYLVRGSRKHKFGYRLSRFKNDPNLKYVEGMTERELADLNKLFRIWDSGKIKYTLPLQ